MSTLKFILKNIDHFRLRFIGTLIAGIIAGVAGFLIPATLAEFTKQPLTSENVIRLIIIIISLYLFSLIMAYIVRGKGEAFAFQYANHIRGKYFHRLTNLSAASLQKVHSGFNLSLINKVSDGVTDILFSIFWNLLPGICVSVLFLVFIARESLVLAIVNALIIGVFIVVSFFLTRRMVPLSAELNHRRASMLETYADFMSNIITVKKLGLRTYAEDRLSHKTMRSNTQIDKVQSFHARRWFLLHALFGVAYVGTICIIIWQISQGTASISLLILFVAAYGTMRSMIEQFAENVRALLEMRAYIEQLDDALTSSPVMSGSLKPVNWSIIHFDDVAFWYEDTTKVTIADFSIKKGQTIAIIGKSGQGKSTFVSLFANNLQPKKGVRYIDDTSYETITADFFEKNIAIVAQDTELFNISIRENLILGQNISDTILLDYIEQLDLLPWFDELEHGLDTIVGEKGLKLSAGQKQRISILRSVLLNREINILDEPTSHLDAHTEELVVKFLKKHLKNKTALIITHRPALQELASELYSMKNHALSLHQENTTNFR